MNYTENEVLDYVKENDVKFVKLCFCDLFGNQKNMSIVSSQLERAFREGIPFDASGVEGFLNVEKDLLLFPDPETLTTLPWRPQSGRVASMFCHVRTADGVFEADGLYILKNAVDRLRDFNLDLSVGTECEFYIFRTDDAGAPVAPYDNASYCDAAPADRCENVRREIVFNLEKMGFKPTSSHHEKGPGQNEIDFQQTGPMTAAMQMLLYKSAVRNVCDRNGLYATFDPKPIENRAGSGLRINLMLSRPGVSVSDNFGRKNGDAEAFLEGILSRVPDIMMFSNPSENSYKRLGEYDAPRYVTWSKGNYGQLAKYFGGKEGGGFKFRFADCLSNPFILLALLIHAGLDGIEERLPLRPPVDEAGCAADAKTMRARTLPADLREALACGEKSAWLKKYLSVDVVEKYACALKARMSASDAGSGKNA